MMAATISRKAFEKTMEVKDTEVMPVVSQVGYPAGKRSVRENLMRKRMKADERQPFGELFYEGTFAKSLTMEYIITYEVEH